MIDMKEYNVLNYLEKDIITYHMEKYVVWIIKKLVNVLNSILSEGIKSNDKREKMYSCI